MEYKKFKDAAQFLGQRESKGAELFTATPEIPDLTTPEESIAEVGIFDLIRAFQKVLRKFEDTHTLREIVDDRWTVSDKIDHLLEIVPVGGRVRFDELFSAATSRSEVIVTFLAMLELMKLHFLEVEQERTLGEIVVVRPSDKIDELAATIPPHMQLAAGMKQKADDAEEEDDTPKDLALEA